MDAKERHELKDNDLAEFLNNFGEWWSKNGNFTMIVVILALAGWFGYRYINQTRALANEHAWADLAATTSPTGYRGIADEYDDFPSIRAQALLRGADQFHQQANKLVQEDNEGGMSPDEALDSAQSLYKRVLDADELPVFRANAALGLANVAETRGDFEAAAGYWDQAKQIADEARLSAIVTQAQIRMDMIESLQTPIIFGEPVPEEAPSEEAADEVTANDPATDAAADELDAAPASPAEPGAVDVAPADPGS